MSAYPQTRPYLRRGSPLSIFNPSQGFASDAPMLQQIDVGDSSDDELPQPMKFSALTKALLESGASPDKHENGRESRNDSHQYAGMEDGDHAAIDTPSRAPLLKIVRRGSPSVSGSGRKSPPRVVHISGSRPGSARRTVSVSDAYSSTRGREATPRLEYKTPAPASRATRLDRQQSESRNVSPAMGYEASATRSASSQEHRSATRNQTDDNHDSVHHFSASQGPGAYVPSTLARSRNVSGEPAPPPGSTRIKRVPIGTGSFLRGAPMRRGFRRRESDDNVSPEEHPTAADSAVDENQHSDAEPRGHGSSAHGREPVSRHDFATSRGHSRDVQVPSKRDTSLDRSRGHGILAARPASRQTSLDRGSRQPSVERPLRQSSIEPAAKRERSDSQSQSSLAHAPRRPSNDHMGTRPTTAEHQPLQQRRPSLSRPPQVRPSSRMHTDAASDQENMPPPTFKRNNKENDFKILGRPEKIALQADVKPRLVADTPVPVHVQQSPRRALTAISGNTPVRPAPPPPPKMSVLDAATKTAGASTTKSKKRRQHILVNGKLFTQMNKVGKGGSSDVYCVMAENYKLFALKKVKLEDCDESAMRGFKGEIDLLEKLKDVERVVRLFDWELDNEKQILSVLMEKGDNDLNRTLTIQLNGVDPRFDPVLTRFYWKEMLECVEAVHEHDIVHSDLKPANFLSVQGKLKLIDFGIANAIDIDNTVNVHRDTHIGTPNYMSPESITDTNAPMPGSERDPNGGRMMKLGKPSDVWSLGCILYQMVYGRPPFAHIANQISRIMAITNHRVVIEYPDKGVGDVAVPPAVKNTLRKCLQRNPAHRPTVTQLLSRNDPFLYPEAGNSVQMSEELLNQIIEKVVERCRDPSGLPAKEEFQSYAGSFMYKIKQMVEKDGVAG